MLNQSAYSTNLALAGGYRVRLATIATPDGPRLHVRGRSGYVDVADGDRRRRARLAAAGPGSAGRWPWTRPRRLADLDGREVTEAEFAPAVPAPPRILCLGLNYSEHALEGGRAVPDLARRVRPRRGQRARRPTPTWSSPR